MYCVITVHVVNLKLLHRTQKEVLLCSQKILVKTFPLFAVRETFFASFLLELKFNVTGSFKTLFGGSFFLKEIE